jgi:CheY-like chemotaxis protein
VLLGLESPAQIVVEDTGLGIDASLMPHLFEMFRQGASGFQRKGLGIGLALVKALAEMHGGSVRAESGGLGKGARFTVELPSIPEPATAGPPPSVAQDQRQYSALLVEDAPDTRYLLSEALSLEGFSVVPASSAEAALDLLRHAIPDVILSDLGLPGMSGYDFLKRARQGGAHAPAFAITGFGQAEDVHRSQEAGFSGHFVKPLDVETVSRRVREHLDARLNRTDQQS